MESFVKPIGRLEIPAPVAEITKALKNCSSGLRVNLKAAQVRSSEIWLPVCNPLHNDSLFSLNENYQIIHFRLIFQRLTVKSTIQNTIRRKISRE